MFFRDVTAPRLGKWFRGIFFVFKSMKDKKFIKCMAHFFIKMAQKYGNVATARTRNLGLRTRNSKIFNKIMGFSQKYNKLKDKILSENLG